MRFIGRTLAAATVLAATAVAMPQGAFARYGYIPSDGDEDAVVVEGRVPGATRADGQGCVKQCPNDMLPCDPPNFKFADGRCSGRRN